MMVTLAKKGDKISRIRAQGFIRTPEAVAKLFDGPGSLAARFANRQGGYTRVIKAGFRFSDQAAVNISPSFSILFLFTSLALPRASSKFVPTSFLVALADLTTRWLGWSTWMDPSRYQTKRSACADASRWKAVLRMLGALRASDFRECPKLTVRPSAQPRSGS